MPPARHSRGLAETVSVEDILNTGYTRLKDPGALRQNPFQCYQAGYRAKPPGTRRQRLAE